MAIRSPFRHTTRWLTAPRLTAPRPARRAPSDDTPVHTSGFDATRFDPTRFDASGELATAQARLAAANTVLLRRRTLEEAERAARAVGVIVPDAPVAPPFSPFPSPTLRAVSVGVPEALAAIPTQPLAWPRAARRAAAVEEASLPTALSDLPTLPAWPNTLLRYSYTPRAGGERSRVGEVDVAGPAEASDFAPYLQEGRFFLAAQVGLPEARADDVPPTAADHAWSRLDLVAPTARPITAPLAGRALRERFRAAAAAGWDEAGALRRHRIPSAPLLAGRALDHAREARPR